MDLIYAVLFGIVLKIYDDLNDLNININPLITESLKSLNIMLFTLIAYNDFSFSLWTLILGLLTYGADNDFWKTFIVISFFLCIVSYSTKPDSLLTLFGFIIISIFFLNIEHKLIPEEASTKKLISRIVLLIGGIIGMYLLGIENIDYTHKGILLGTGAAFISIISQIYLLYFNKTDIINKSS
jgi:hypothetical protein